MNGNHNCGSSGASGVAPATVSVPQRIHSVTQQYLGIMNYLSQSHDIWDQADLKAREYKGANSLSLYFLLLESFRKILADLVPPPPC